MNRFRAVAPFLLLLLSTFSAIGEELHRPKIGLALSGGGALGMAHIGALKALEELQIPVDYIAGTSMGAVVGGLYASGVSPKEIDDWFRNADWTFLLSDSLPRESEPFRVKQRQFDMNKGLAMNVAKTGELKLPRGLLVGRNIIASLRELTVQVRNVRDFSKLPIPFRAMGTDLVTGDLVVLKSGDLVQSVRASMSIPGIFTPVGLDGHQLADGGVAMNLPISQVREMGADVVIAIDSSAQLLDAKHLDSAAAVTNQVLTIFVQKQMQREIATLGPSDALVRIYVPDMDSTDFMKAALAIDTGYAETMKHRAELAKFSRAGSTFQSFLARQRHPRGEPVMISYVKLETPEGTSQYRLPKPLPFDLKEHDNIVRLQSVIGDIGPLQKYEVGDFEVLGDDGEHGLLVRAHNPKVGPNFLSFGLRYDYSSTDETDFGVLLSYRMTELNRLGAEWELFLSLGDSTRISTEFYQPVDPSRRFFIAPNGLFASDFVNGRDESGERLRFRRQDWLGGLDVGARIGQMGEARLGYLGGSTSVTRRFGFPDDYPTHHGRGLLHADFTWDALDEPSFAKRGEYLHASLVASREGLGGDSDYTRLEGQAYKPITFGENTLVPRLVANVKLNGSVPTYDNVALGGFLNLSGYSRGELFGESSAVAELVYYRKFIELTPGILPGIYGGVSLEAGEVWGKDRAFRVNDATVAGSIFMGADTLAGGFVLGFGVAEGGHTAIYLQLGPLFGQDRRSRQPPR